MERGRERSLPASSVSARCSGEIYRNPGYSEEVTEYCIEYEIPILPASALPPS